MTGITVVAATVFVVSRKLDIPIGGSRISEKIKQGEAINDSKNKDVNDHLLRTRQLRMIYTLNEDKISGIYLEILNSPRKTVNFVEIPRSTKISISDELFKELQTYSPTLPQYVKVSKLDTHFSSDYRFEAMTKVFGETLEESIDCWIAVNEEIFEMWCNKGYSHDEFHAEDFFNIFDKMYSEKLSSIDGSEYRMYYENYLDCEFLTIRVVPGDWEKTDYIIKETAARELVEELKY